MQYGIQSTKLSKLDLGWILSHTKCELKWWSQIDNILSRYSSDTAATANSSIISRCQSLASDVESLGVDANKEDRCTFLAEQLRLMCTAAKGRRYSIDIIIYSFLFFYKLPACYEALRNTLCLPSNKLLLDISSNMHIDSGNVCENYPKSRAAQLKSNELMVSIQLDEIHLKSRVV